MVKKEHGHGHKGYSAKQMNQVKWLCSQLVHLNVLEQGLHIGQPPEVVVLFLLFERIWSLNENATPLERLTHL